MTNTVSVVTAPCADLKVVNAARVSMNKQHTEFDEDADTRLIRYLARHGHWTPFVHNRELILFPINSLTLYYHFTEMLSKLTPEDSAGMVVEYVAVPNSNVKFFAIKHSLYGWTNLLKKMASHELYVENSVSQRILSIIKTKYPVSSEYLLENNEHVSKIQMFDAFIAKNNELVNAYARYLSPAMFDMTFYEKVPIFVARQRFKAMIQFDYNEVSRRYVDDTPYFYYPAEDGWRARPDKSIKQGSAGTHEDSKDISKEYHEYIKNAEVYYEKLIKQGVAPEQARMVLPQSMVTEYFATGNIVAIQRLLKQRLDEHAQLEIREFAAQMQQEVEHRLKTMESILESGYKVIETLETIGVF